jgi:serine/threonine protein kinase
MVTAALWLLSAAELSAGSLGGRALHPRVLPALHSTHTAGGWLVLCCPLRDLKAENVLMLPDGTWVLCDYGSTTTR